MFSNPWAITIYIIRRRTGTSGKYSEMISIPDIVGTLSKDEIAQEHLRRKVQETKAGGQENVSIMGEQKRGQQKRPMGRPVRRV